MCGQERRGGERKGRQVQPAQPPGTTPGTALVLTYPSAASSACQVRRCRACRGGKGRQPQVYREEEKNREKTTQQEARTLQPVAWGGAEARGPGPDAGSPGGCPRMSPRHPQAAPPGCGGGGGARSWAHRGGELSLAVLRCFLQPETPEAVFLRAEACSGPGAGDRGCQGPRGEPGTTQWQQRAAPAQWSLGALSVALATSPAAGNQPSTS